MGKQERKGASRTFSTTLRLPLEQEDDKASKDAGHLQKAQDARDVDQLIVLVLREGAPPATLHSRFSEDKSLLSSMGYLSSMRFSHEYVERLVSGVIVFGVVSEWQEASGWQFFGERMFGFWIHFRSCTGIRSLAYWLKVYI